VHIACTSGSRAHPNAQASAGRRSGGGQKAQLRSSGMTRRGESERPGRGGGRLRQRLLGQPQRRHGQPVRPGRQRSACPLCRPVCPLRGGRRPVVSRGRGWRVRRPCQAPRSVPAVASPSDSVQTARFTRSSSTSRQRAAAAGGGSRRIRASSRGSNSPASRQSSKEKLSGTNAAMSSSTGSSANSSNAP
jgi:hypothetical protein